MPKKIHDFHHRLSSILMKQSLSVRQPLITPDSSGNYRL
uniref:Uncharacterized protein n=1 Tax=Lepeophtheirus salmonis TaxID=72036 RepID=A0A0K2UEI8_LEPSM